MAYETVAALIAAARCNEVHDYIAEALAFPTVDEQLEAFSAVAEDPALRSQVSFVVNDPRFTEWVVNACNWYDTLRIVERI
jgi:hypothetical protein